MVADTPVASYRRSTAGTTVWRRAAKSSTVCGMHADCPFCLDNHLLRSSVIAETDGAFLIEAYNFPDCHLIIPKDHIETLDSLPDYWWRHFKQLLAQIPELSDDYNLSLNYGQPAGQTVPHLHFWIIPRPAGQAASGKGLATLVRLHNEAAQHET